MSFQPFKRLRCLLGVHKFYKINRHQKICKHCQKERDV